MVTPPHRMAWQVLHPPGPQPPFASGQPTVHTTGRALVMPKTSAESPHPHPGVDPLTMTRPVELCRDDRVDDLRHSGTPLS
jgi:hypothetical protein